jgi:hypothetical protein
MPWALGSWIAWRLTKSAQVSISGQLEDHLHAIEYLPRTHRGYYIACIVHW